MGQIIACCLMAPSDNPTQCWLLMTSCAPLWLLSIQVMTYVDDENKFEWIIFKMSPGFNEFRDLSGKALYVQILLILTECYWIYNGYFHLKFKHVNKSHISFNRFIVNKSWPLYQMPWFFSKIYCPVSGHSLCISLVSPPQLTFPWVGR